MTRRRAYQLKRSDLRQEKDRPTNSVILRYTGSALRFDEYLYGYPEDTIFAVPMDDLPWPPELEELSIKLGVSIDPLPDASRLRAAVADAIAAGALVDAPIHMDDLAVDRDVEWPAWTRHELERKHRIAEARVAGIVRCVASDMKLRAAGFKSPSFEVTKVETAPPTTEEVPEEQAPLVEVDAVEDSVYEPGSATVQRVRVAVQAAREQELPQRLPGGMRRRLSKAPPAAYIMHGDVMDVRVDLCAALTDARSMSRADRETVVVDYDGEWPVVVRRYGQDGRTIYKVEDALRRYGIDVPKAS